MHYCDHNASTPPHPQVVELVCSRAGLPQNPSSLHHEGQAAAVRVEASAASLRRLLGAGPAAEVTFVSGGTEADFGVLCIAQAVRQLRPGAHIIIASRVEHPAMTAALEASAALDFAIEWLPLRPTGEVDLAPLARIDRSAVALATLIFAHNETGVVQPVEELCRWAGDEVPVFADAVQAVGKVPVDMTRCGLSAVAVAGHKIGGPRGVGAVVCRAGLSWRPLFVGGKQQQGRRAGTEPVALIEGLAVAAELALTAVSRPTALPSPRQRFIDMLSTGEGAPGLWLLDASPKNAEQGAGPRYLPQTLMLGVQGIPALRLVRYLAAEGVTASAGAACHRGGNSGVLAQMGYTATQCGEALRLSFAPPAGRPTDIAAVVRAFGAALGRARHG